MHLRKIRSSSLIAVFSLFILFGCGDDEAKKPSFNDYEYSSTLRATITSNGMTSETEGYVTVDNGQVTIETSAGTLTGTVQETPDGYAFVITEGTGSFSDVTDFSGLIDLNANTTVFSGTNPGGSSITISGENAPIPLMTDGGWDDLEKASAIFTHSESGLLVSITVNGETFEGLNAHYNPGGRCDSYYALGNSIPGNVDNQESELFCNSGTLRGLDGQPVNFTDCNTIRFVLDKNKEYTYNATWSNGSVTSGKFKTPGGGRMIAVCPSASDGGGGTGCSIGSGKFKIGSSTVSAVYKDCYTEEGYYAIEAESSNYNEVGVAFSSKPTVSGRYSVIDGEENFPSVGQAVVYAYVDGTDRDYYSSGGGEVNVTVANGYVTAVFCNIPMKDEESSATTKVAGNLTCE